MGIFGKRNSREFDDDDGIEYVDTGELCTKCGMYNDPIRIDRKCKYCGCNIPL